MALKNRNPFQVWLGGDVTIDDNMAYEASAAITPGMQVELHLSGSQMMWRPHNAVTGQSTAFFALERHHSNKTIDDAYAIGDAVRVGCFQRGSIGYGLIPSGQDISKAEYLQSNGDGKFRTASATTAAANVARFQSLDGPGAVTADTRVRFIVL